MKYIKIIILSLILLGIIFILSGCNGSTAKTESRFKAIDFGDCNIIVVYDKKTKVEYAIIDKGYRAGIAMIILVDQEGKPLLYKGE